MENNNEMEIMDEVEVIDGVEDAEDLQDGMTLKDGVLDGGEFAHIYFTDWDHVRARRRQVNVTVMGTTEDVGDRKYNNGEVIDTLRKFTDEEKEYDRMFDFQLNERKKE